METGKPEEVVPSEPERDVEPLKWPSCDVRVKEPLNEREIENEQKVFSALSSCGLFEPSHSPQIHTLYHSRARTCAEADENAKGIKGAFTKTLFVRDHGKPPHYWLILTVGGGRVNLRDLRKVLGGRRDLRMVGSDVLLRRLKVTSGAVTPLALMNDTDETREPGEEPIHLFIDRAFWNNPEYEKLLNVHPMHNAASTTMGIDDLVAFCASVGHPVEGYLDFSSEPVTVEFVNK